MTLSEGKEILRDSSRLWWQNTKDFWRRFRKHPLAVLGLVILIIYILMAIFAPFIAPHDPNKQSISNRLLPPMAFEGGTSEYPLGTDYLGRDILSRIIYGSRVSLLVGVISIAISVFVGFVLGAIAGYYRGFFDTVLSRFSELLMAFPFLIFTIFVMAILGPGFWNLIVALTFKAWVEFFRLVRGEIMSEMTKEYIEAARALGRSSKEIITLEIVPNIFHSVLVLATLRMGYMIITEASLSFLGIGVPPRIPAWGTMVADGRDYILNAWWISTLPGLAIVILVLSINLFGEGLRDVLDPRLKKD